MIDFSSFTTWLLGLVKAVLSAAFDMLTDLLVGVLDMVLAALGALISALPVPSFLSQSDVVGNLLSGLPPYSLYCIGQLHIPEAFAIVAAGVSFRLLRKAVTLFQW